MPRRLHTSTLTDQPLGRLLRHTSSTSEKSAQALAVYRRGMAVVTCHVLHAAVTVENLPVDQPHSRTRGDREGGPTPRQASLAAVAV